MFSKYNHVQNIVDKFTKSSKAGVSLESLLQIFRNFLAQVSKFCFAYPAVDLPSIPSLSGILLNFPC